MTHLRCHDWLSSHRTTGKNRNRSCFNGRMSTADFYNLLLERIGIFLQIFW